LVVALCATTLAIGSVNTPVLCGACVLFAFSALLLSVGQEPFVPRQAATLLLFTAIGLAMYTALQRVPLPIAVLSALAPHNADVWSRALRPLHEAGPAFAPISLDPTATNVQILRGATYVLALLASLRVAQRREGSALLERALLATAIVVAVAAIVHPALGIERVYGLYKPKTDASSIAPLLNTNHLGAYVNVGIILALGSVLSDHPIAPRPLLGAFALLLAAAEVWLASRGGVATMLVGMVLVVGLTLATRRRLRTNFLSWALPGALAVIGAGLIVLSAFEATWRGLTDRDLSKLSITATCLRRMLPAYLFFGTGRGAFESTFPEFREGGGFFIFTHPENLVAQWTVEWGLPVALAAFGAVAYALRPKTLFARSPAPIGPWCAIVTVVLHNLVDFSLEIPGVTVALVACAACVVAGTGVASRTTPRSPLWGRAPGKIAAVAAAAGAVAGIAALSSSPHELVEDKKNLFDLATSRTTSVEAFHAEARSTMLAHPAEPYFAYVGAARASATRSESLVPWIERALARARVYPPAHVLLARWLRGPSPSQARLEYRIASEQLGGLVFDREEIAPLVDGYDDALELAPDGESGTRVLVAIAGAVQDRLPATTARLDAEIARRAPDQVDPPLRTARRGLDDLLAEEAAPWCAANRAKCLEGALSASSTAERLAPARCEAFATTARLLAAQGDPRRAVQHLAKATDTVTDRAACLHELASLAATNGLEEQASAAVDRLSRAPCVSEAACAENLVSAADLELQRGNTNRALVYLRRAAAKAPERDDVLERIGAQTSRVGLHAEALGAYEKLSARHPGDARLRALVDGERIATQAAPLR
jgi:tetratricopeptide (TPR) repeat protein